MGLPEKRPKIGHRAEVYDEATSAPFPSEQCPNKAVFRAGPSPGALAAADRTFAELARRLTRPFLGPPAKEPTDSRPRGRAPRGLFPRGKD
jgi:hypothetical protein